MEKEIWKDVPGYEGRYQASNKGRIKRDGLNMKGYYTGKSRRAVVYLHKNKIRKQFYIHQLVAMAFLGHTPCGHKIDVHHKDGNKHNNNLSNLELLTRQEHIIETWKSRGKTSAYVGVCWNKASKRWRAQITINGKKKYIGHFKDEVSASEAYQKALTEAEK